MKRPGKKDIWLLFGLLSLILILWLVLISRRESGSYVTITIDGELYGRYSLDTEQEIPIVIDNVTTNLLLIQNKTADMTEANCPDKLCVHQPAISRSMESIVCLPNRVVVTVESGKTAAVDSVAR